MSQTIAEPPIIWGDSAASPQGVFMPTATKNPPASLHLSGKGNGNGKIQTTGKATPSKLQAHKMVFYFGKTRVDGDAGQKPLLGGKGANLADMTSIGLPVPPGFTITTDTCAAYYRNGQRLPHGLMNEVHRNIAMLEKESGKKFGDNANPLLVSVRSGAAVSMPGMMDTILNLGLTDVPEAGMVELCDAYKAVYQRYVGEVFPQNPFKQLELAIEAVFKSWNGDRAIAYRRIAGIQG